MVSSTKNGGRPRTVAVIGGGATGTLVAIHLLRKKEERAQVILIERRQDIGRGVAYSTRSMRHLLNVPAANMSALVDEPDHFLRWLRSGPIPAATPETFSPRPVYGDYLEATLAETERNVPPSLVRLRAEAVSVVSGDGATVRLGDGRVIRADRAVLAVGNFPPRNPQTAESSFYGGPCYVADAWAPGALDEIASDAPVLLIGTSLTAIDVAISLKERGHEAPIHAVSRRGLVPNAYKRAVSSPTYPTFVRPGGPGSEGVRALVRRVREEVQRAEARGRDWHGVVEALRPEAQALWVAMPEAERRRFLRHIQPYWEVHRHRIAPEIGAEVRGMREEGRFRVMAGRITGYREHPDGAAVRVRPRGGSKEKSFSVGHVVNCTAPTMDVRGARSSLVAGLLESGAARPGPLNIGLDTDGRGALLGLGGSPSGVLYAIGSLRKGNLWETIAVPEIRAQAALLAEELLWARTEDPSRAPAKALRR